jgi:methylmalonyl-CoA mutase C-terminal domain/subunit
VTAATTAPEPAPRVLLAKTSLDGHWRGLVLVARALRDAGFEIVMAGQATAEQIAATAEEEDVDLVGLNVGGRIEVVERVLAALRETCPGVPVLVGGTIPPGAVRRLEDQVVRVFPPGSSVDDIVGAARAATHTSGPSS